MPASSPKASSLALSLSKVGVSLSGHQILSEITFEVARGQIAALIGPNGAGKTTLVRTMLGLVAHSGEIKVLGQKPKDVRQRVGYAPQKFEFDRDFPITVAEFLRLSSKAAIEARLGEVLAEVGMSGQERKPLGELSGGQLQRVLIARALLGQPEVLFLDEPTAGVDIEGEQGFYELIHDLNEKHGTTIVMVSHEVNMVYAFATQVICLNRDLYCAGAPKEVITREMLSKLYGGKFELKDHHH